MMADFMTVPIVDIHMDNFKEMWPTIMLALRTSVFVALDTELSGLGDRKRLSAISVEDRYSAMAEIAKTRSVLSLGISCFRLDQEQPSLAVSPTNEDHFQHTENSKMCKTLQFVAQTFNVLLLCSENFIVEPDSLKFLVGHGFDFNKQYAKGIPYHRGNDHEDEVTKQACHSIRGLFTALVQLAVPVVFHNALVDLVFLYQSFYASLPLELGIFVADLADMFAGGTYDTKYLAEFQAHMPASYLQYVFRKSQRENYARATLESPHVCLSFLTYPEKYQNVAFLLCGICERTSEDAELICSKFAAHGWCLASGECPLSHDIDLILDNEDLLVPVNKRRRIRKHKKQQQSDSICSENESKMTGELGSGVLESATVVKDIFPSIHQVVQSESAFDNDSESIGLTFKREKGSMFPEGKRTKLIQSDVTQNGCHRAGFDAFMTGFVFACFVQQYGCHSSLPKNANLSDFRIHDYRNKITLSGKDIPLQIVKSNFVKLSKDHKTKMSRVRIT